MGTGNSDYQIGKPSIDYTTKLISPKGRGPATYLEVKYRLQLLRELFPEAQVTTQELAVDPANGFAAFHARVVLPNGAVGEGTGSETARDFGDFIEKAETKAIGRALSAAGIGHQYGIADFEYESDSRKDYVGVDSPVPPERAAAPARQPRAVRTPAPETPASEIDRDAEFLREKKRIGLEAVERGCRELLNSELAWRSLDEQDQMRLLAWMRQQPGAPAQEAAD